MHELKFPSLRPSPLHKTHFDFYKLNFLFPSGKRMGQQSYRVLEMDYFTLLPQFSAQRRDRLGCYLVYFLHHNHTQRDGLHGLNSP